MTLALHPAPAPLARGTLSRRLVLRVSALVALVAVALSALGLVGAYNIQLSQLDARLEAAGMRTMGDRDDDSNGPGSRGQEVGTLAVWVTSSAARGSVLTETASGKLGVTPLDASVVQQLATISLSPGQKATVQLTGLGAYRVVKVPTRDRTVLVGLPMGQLARGLTSFALLEGVLVAITVVVAFVVTRAVVIRSLAPLNRLASTAASVSTLELERGEVELPMRVAEADTDPTSEVGRVGHAFNRMLDNVEGALAARHASETKVRQFVADASHELRNPLASIRGYAELTRRERDSLSPTLTHALVRIESESDRMSRLVEDLLLLARLDSGPSLDLKPTDLTEVVLNAVSDARAAGADHSWSLRVPDSPVVARADRFRMHQVLANLLANARTHTPPGTAVRAVLSTEPGWAVIEVSDNGPGIPAHLIPTVFERFTRADEARVRQSGGSSTGLGLAIVAAVVAGHHGTASVSSRPGDTRFIVRVPLAG